MEAAARLGARDLADGVSNIASSGEVEEREGVPRALGELNVSVHRVSHHRDPVGHDPRHAGGRTVGDRIE